MATTNQKLIGLTRAEFNKAQSLQQWIFRIQIAITGVAVAAVFFETWAYATALASMALAFLWGWLWWMYQRSRSQAERARRATLIFDGAEDPISEDDLLDLQSNFTVTNEAGSKLEDPHYYATSAKPGNERLARKLEESAFYTKDLLAVSAIRTWAWFIVFGTLGLLFLFASVPLVAAEHLQGGVRVVCSLMILLASTDVLGTALSYGRAARDLGSMMPRFQSLRMAGYRTPDLLLILGDYNSAVEGAPIPRKGIYEKRKNHLNGLWAQYKNSETAA